MTNPIPRIKQFYQETITELKKCTWPTRQELIESTFVVILSIVMLGIFVAAVDRVTWQVVQWLTTR